MINIFLIQFFIFFACFLLRAWPRFVLPNGLASDTFFHLYYSKLIRKSKHIVPKMDNRFILNPEVNYPFLFHWILSFFSSKRLFFAERYCSAFFDSLNSLVVFNISIYLLKTNPLNLEISILTASFFCIAPGLFKNSDEPRVHNGSTRVLAQFVYFLHFFGVIMAIQNNLIGYIIAVVAGALIFITTVFGIQVLLFFTLIFSPRYPVYLVITPLAFVFSLIISGGRSYSIIKLNFQHSVYLFKSKLYYQKIHIKRDVIEFISGVKSILLNLFTIKVFPFIKSLYSSKSIVIKNLIAFHPFLILLNFNLFYKYEFVFIWGFAAIAIFLLTKLPQLRFLGKPERYLEFALPAAYFLVGVWLIELNVPIYCIICYLLFNLLGTQVYNFEFIKEYKQYQVDYNDDMNFFKKFNEIKTEGTIWTLHPFLYKPMYYTSNKLHAFFAGTINYSLITDEEKADFLVNYPHPSYDLISVIKKYDIRFVITDKTYFKHYLDKGRLNYSDILSCSSNSMESKNFIMIDFRKLD